MADQVTLMLSVAVRALFTMSVTVMVCVPRLRREDLPAPVQASPRIS
jgi:hypothetical protein